MELFGYPIQTVYLTTLIVSGALTVLYIFFGDIVEAALDFLNPTLILAFVTFLSASGYLLELITPLNSLVILFIAIVIALILDTLLNIFVLVPMSSAEESLVYTSDSLKGRVGRVLIPIPQDGFGEVVLKSSSGTISKPARSFDNQPIAEGEKVLVIDVKDGVLHVAHYEKTEKLFFT
jgi:membrane-bound ClpP family serine protease